MSIDNQSLENELNNYGNVIICAENNTRTYIVAIDNVITDVTTLKNIIDGYVLSDFQILKDIRLSDGVFKCLYIKS
tara:strand:+ start:840 stop:1067 length:228 start_codon:yes stop_codon:yes gene_type:complete